MRHLSISLFQSTPPVKAATSPASATVVPNSISIHAAREGGDANGYDVGKIDGISIHAAREGGDDFLAQQDHDKTISIHAAREGGDNSIFRCFIILIAFQSTPPVKAATKIHFLFLPIHSISIHAAREGGDDKISSNNFLSNRISIHAAREGGDILTILILCRRTDFNPRRP